MVDIKQELTAAQVMAGEKQYIAQTYKRGPMVLSHGQGMYVWDTDGKQYLDFMAGLSVKELRHTDTRTAATRSRPARDNNHPNQTPFFRPPQKDRHKPTL